MVDAPKNFVPSLQRALKIIEYLSDAPDGVLTSDLASELRYPRNSVFRICSTLQSLGYLKKDIATAHVRLSRKFFSIGYKVLSEVNIVSVARPHAQKLRDQTKETVLIGTLLERNGAVLEEFAGLHHFNFRISPGANFYIHCTAPGKALLAFLPDDECENYLESINFHKFNENTITCKHRLREHLQLIKESGVAYDAAEQIVGCHCIASPVLNQYAYPIATIWVTGPSSRIPQKDFSAYGTLVQKAATSISKELGFSA